MQLVVIYLGQLLSVAELIHLTRIARTRIQHSTVQEMPTVLNLQAELYGALVQKQTLVTSLIDMLHELGWHPP